MMLDKLTTWSCRVASALTNSLSSDNKGPNKYFLDNVWLVTWKKLLTVLIRVRKASRWSLKNMVVCTEREHEDAKVLRNCDKLTQRSMHLLLQFTTPVFLYVQQRVDENGFLQTDINYNMRNVTHMTYRILF